MKFIITLVFANAFTWPVLAYPAKAIPTYSAEWSNSSATRITPVPLDRTASSLKGSSISFETAISSLASTLYNLQSCTTTATIWEDVRSLHSNITSNRDFRCVSTISFAESPTFQTLDPDGALSEVDPVRTSAISGSDSDETTTLHSTVTSAFRSPVTATSRSNIGMTASLSIDTVKASVGTPVTLPTPTETSKESICTGIILYDIPIPYATYVPVVACSSTIYSTSTVTVNTQLGDQFLQPAQSQEAELLGPDYTLVGYTTTKSGSQSPSDLLFGLIASSAIKTSATTSSVPSVTATSSPTFIPCTSSQCTIKSKPVCPGCTVDISTSIQQTLTAECPSCTTDTLTSTSTTGCPSCTADISTSIQRTAEPEFHPSSITTPYSSSMTDATSARETTVTAQVSVSVFTFDLGGGSFEVLTVTADSATTEVSATASVQIGESSLIENMATSVETPRITTLATVQSPEDALTTATVQSPEYALTTATVQAKESAFDNTSNFVMTAAPMLYGYSTTVETLADGSLTTVKTLVTAGRPVGAPITQAPEGVLIVTSSKTTRMSPSTSASSLTDTVYGSKDTAVESFTIITSTSQGKISGPGPVAGPQTGESILVETIPILPATTSSSSETTGSDEQVGTRRPFTLQVADSSPGTMLVPLTTKSPISTKTVPTETETPIVTNVVLTLDSTSITLLPDNTQPETSMSSEPKTTTVPAVINLGKTSITDDSASHFVVASQTLTAGEVVTISGSQGATTISLALSATEAVINGETQVLQTSVVTAQPNKGIATPPATSAVVLDSSTITENPASEFVIGTQTLRTDSPITISDTHGTTTFSFVPSNTALVVNGVTSSIHVPITKSLQQDVQQHAPQEITVGPSIFTANSASAFVIGSQTLSPGAELTVSGTTISLAQSATAVVVNGVTSDIPTPTIDSSLPQKITVGSSVFTANSKSNFVLGSQTLVPGAEITVSGTTISLASSASAVVINGFTLSFPTQAQDSSQDSNLLSATASEFIVAGQTLAPGGVITVQDNTLSLAASGSGIVINGVTSAFPTPSIASMPEKITIGSSTLTANTASEFVFVSQTLSPGSQITVSGTTFSLAPSATAIVVNGKTSQIITKTGGTAVAELTLDSTVVTANTASQFVVASQTLSPDSAITVSGTTYSLAPSITAVVINGKTTPISAVPSSTPEIVLGSSVFTENPTSTAFVLAGQTLTPGKTVTVSGTTIALLPSGNGVIINGNTSVFSVAPSTTPAPQLLTIGSQTYTATSGAFIVGGQTLSNGGVAIVSGTVISLGPSGAVLGVISTLSTEVFGKTGSVSASVTGTSKSAVGPSYTDSLATATPTGKKNGGAGGKTYSRIFVWISLILGGLFVF